MKKGLMIAGGITGLALIASELMKNLGNNKAAEEKIPDGNSADECGNTEKKSEGKKTKSHNESMVRVNNSLISIKLKVFSK